MNDERTPESPVMPEQTPDHAPDFWNRLDAALQDEPALSKATTGATAQMPQLASVGGDTAIAPTPPVRRPQPKWPLAAAAAAVVVLGLGFLVARSLSDPATTTEIVAAPTTEVEVVPADGTGQDGGETPDNASTDVQEAEAAPAAATDGSSGDGDEPDGPTQGSTDPDGDASDGAEPRPAPPIPDFDAARGATGDPEYLPLDQGIPADGTFLANWSQRGLTWYAVTDQNTNCANANYGEIRYVNASGITQPVRDPQLRFSGEISHFVVRNEQNVAAWVVACGEQLELYVAMLEPTGRIAEPTLVWLGRGSTSSALVLWETNEVSLNAIEPDGAAFAIDYNIETGLLSRNGGPSRIMLEAGAPAERSLTPLASSPDGGLTYWQGEAQAGTISACAALFGSGQSDMLWLRQGEGQWQPAVAGDFPVGSITAATLDSASLQFAFADVCAGESGRVVVGTQLPDGRVGDIAEIDLTPFVPGYAAQLFWVDESTLRIETDNSEFGFGTVRFDYRLDQELIVQLD